MEPTLIPVVYCWVCEATNPVVIEEIPAEMMGTEASFTAIYCPICQNIINMESDLEVSYYTPEELEKVGWKYEQ